MNTLEDVQKKVLEFIPDAAVTLDLAETSSGSSWLDMKYRGQALTVEHKASYGFGLYSSNDNSYGTRPDEIYRDEDSLMRRIQMLLLEKKFDIKLKEIRELLGKNQSELSKLLGQQQPAISKLESRSDIQLSSIEKIITALGGDLEIKAHFKEFDIPISLSSKAN